ncbi:hypothetical protein AMET1_1058 [Methanonatronarchaeum thermophilum]|uniref:Uncharacterized protein n=1 Tax=Methanonatronarchaeum thermophilum TaxID=1927129 RepID=A0A1Y3GFB5_9EURY|nr:hypothetical protein [Methanonatronarchaeum thermophilum]OUJ18155.1 hypothetical protein AMET1_1058 [Methanonatronarchaeum thermophilum]
MKTKTNIKREITKKDLDLCSLEIHDALESRIERMKKETSDITTNHCPLTIHNGLESRIERINKY